MEHLAGLAPLAAGYDGFLLDLWGVVHDGVSLYPGTLFCLQQLRAAGKRCVMLSNAPRRAAAAAAGLDGLGLARELYAGVVTSGEITRAALAGRSDPFVAALGPRLYHLGPVRDRNLFEGLPLTAVGTPEEADFVLNTGPDDDRNPTELGPFEETLAACRARDLPMLCANPDLEVIRGGVRVICAGALAARYRELGGTVREFGKPDAAVYHAALGLLDLSPARVLAVGDALRTDILGASRMGIDSLWILSGIHDLAGRPGQACSAARAAGLAPRATADRFAWDASPGDASSGGASSGGASLSR